MNILKLSGIEEDKKCEIQIDYYVPFSVHIGDCYNFIKENIVYWRTGDIERSLIEIGIGSNTGILKKITLTSAVNAVLSDISVNIKTIEEGTPIFDPSIIPQKGIYDYVNDFHVYLDNHRITTVINSIDKCTKLIRLKRLDIGVDNNNYLTHIVINDLTTDEYKELKESLKL